MFSRREKKLLKEYELAQQRASHLDYLLRNLLDRYTQMDEKLVDSKDFLALIKDDICHTERCLNHTLKKMENLNYLLPMF